MCLESTMGGESSIEVKIRSPNFFMFLDCAHKTKVPMIISHTWMILPNRPESSSAFPKERPKSEQEAKQCSAVFAAPK